MKQWKEETYSKIRKGAKKIGATIYFGDEASIRSDYHSGTTGVVSPGTSGFIALSLLGFVVARRRIARNS